jgi:poly-gamma-glutamate system protein
MIWRKGNAPLSVLIFLAVLALFLFGMELRSRALLQAPLFSLKLKAAQKMTAALDEIGKERERLGIPVDRVNDPNGTGVIGHHYSVTTTHRGDLTEKLTSLNPNVAAAMVELVRKAKVKEGDRVAVGWTGSTPGMNIGLLAALDVLGLEPVIVTALGSSMWGANDPRFTWLDMESLLVDREIFSHRSVAASIGGASDNGRGLSIEGRDLLRQAIVRNGVELIEEEILEESVLRRTEIYLGYSVPVIQYINVGFGAASVGDPDYFSSVRSGELDPRELVDLPGNGVAAWMLAHKIPVIHLGNSLELAERYHLPVDPIPLPTPGRGRLFYTERYSVRWAVIYGLILLIVLFISVRVDLKALLLRRNL